MKQCIPLLARVVATISVASLSTVESFTAMPMTRAFPPPRGNAVKHFQRPKASNTSTTRKRVSFATHLSTHSLARRAGILRAKILNGVAL